MDAIARFSAESVRLSATGNSTELGGVVHELYVHSAWFPVAVNRIMEWTPLHDSQLSQTQWSATGNSTERTNIIPDVDSRSSAREA